LVGINPVTGAMLTGRLTMKNEVSLKTGLPPSVGVPRWQRKPSSGSSTEADRSVTTVPPAGGLLILHRLFSSGSRSFFRRRLAADFSLEMKWPSGLQRE